MRNGSRPGTRLGSECLRCHLPVMPFIARVSTPRRTVGRHAAALLPIVWLATSSPSEATLADALRASKLRPFAEALPQTIARALPLPTASAGVVFNFDFETGSYVRDPAIAGQLFLERADPIGKGRWNLSLAYEYIHFDSFDGEDIRHLQDTALPILVNP